MIQQIIKSGVGVRFNQAAFTNWMALFNDALSPPSGLHQDAGAAAAKNHNGNSVTHSSSGNTTYQANANLNPDIGDSLKVHKFSDIFIVSFWWLLECLPFQRKYQDLADPKKKWKVTYWYVSPLWFVFVLIVVFQIIIANSPFSPLPFFSVYTPTVND